MRHHAGDALPIKAGVLGMARTMAWWPSSQRDRSTMRMPAAIETISWAPMKGFKLATTSRICCGLTASTTTSTLAMAPSMDCAVATPNLSLSACSASALRSTTWMSSAAATLPARPPINAAAMLPPPMNAIFTSAPCVFV
jgi:hypothetical protein